ncbi:hypothetical protein ABAZ39_13110 [Azospirillum argentinense]|uniref:Uncharacterized protein n=1 Tax=Azospirillum argentinense TaxID=2970906 RepID=A0A060DPV7_9PROT|nr:hypothetical protein [Azospirillum argentinense]AIB12909.1 hypothetical protein ABAZ39_13110 [Azospirillum argentinense]EZQ09651.1 hypothetical protein ABAZ39_14520 [Azospirillum argentinense]
MPDGSYHFTTHAIRTLDLSWLEAQLVRHHGFEPERARRVIEHYRCVLEIAADHPNRAIAPPAGADKAWHVHMLNNKRYNEDCLRLFGTVLHHDPELCGTPAFWDAWDFTREQFAARLGVALPATADVKGAAPDFLPIRTDRPGGPGPDVMPEYCMLEAREP